MGSTTASDSEPQSKEGYSTPYFAKSPTRIYQLVFEFVFVYRYTNSGIIYTGLSRVTCLIAIA